MVEQKSKSKTTHSHADRPKPLAVVALLDDCSNNLEDTVRTLQEENAKLLQLLRSRKFFSSPPLKQADCECRRVQKDV